MKRAQLMNKKRYLKNYINSEEMADYFYDTYYDVEWEEGADFASKINKR